jgi:hypothetical protein
MNKYYRDFLFPSVVTGQVLFSSLLLSTVCRRGTVFSVFVSVAFHGFQNFSTIGWMYRCQMKRRNGITMQGKHTMAENNHIVKFWKRLFVGEPVSFCMLTVWLYGRKLCITFRTWLRINWLNHTNCFYFCLGFLDSEYNFQSNESICCTFALKWQSHTCSQVFHTK